MPNEIRRIYWDSCVLLSLVEGAPDRIGAIQMVFDECRNGKCEIWTSHLSIAEVAFAKAEKDGKAISDEVEKKIDDLWHVESPLKTADVFELITLNAKALIRGFIPSGLGLKPPDAIHLVTAKQLECAEFHTYDHKLFRHEKRMGYKIHHPCVDGMLPWPSPRSPLRGVHAGQLCWQFRLPSSPLRRLRHPFLSSRQHKARMRNRQAIK